MNSIPTQHHTTKAFLPPQHPISPENNAATTIQKLFRGSQAREAFLPRSLYPLYKEECKNTEIRFMSLATAGKTPVYLPDDFEAVVLKEAGREKAIQRFHKMQEVRSVLKTKQCSHLVIPRARLYKEFIVEERLPISPRSFHNITLYTSNPTLFDEPVREMVRLFSKIYISSLTNFEIDKPNNKMYVTDIRYDNISFYMTYDKGRPVSKIALPDLERARESNEMTDIKKLISLGIIFPLHYEIIKEAALREGMEFNPRDIEKATNMGKNYFQGIQAPTPDFSSGRSSTPKGKYLH